MYGNNENFSIIYKLIESFKNKKKIVIYNNGDAVRDFIHVDDVCEVYIKLLGNKKSAIYDVGSGQGIKIKDILQFIKLPKKNITFKKNKITELPHSIADIYKLQKNIKKTNFIKIENFLKKKLVINLMIIN